MLTEVNTRDKLIKLIENEPALMIYFYSNNCSPCVSLRPKVDAVIRERFPKMKLVFIDSEKYTEIASAYNVFSNPVIITFFESREYRRESKYISMAQLIESIKRPYELIFS